MERGQLLGDNENTDLPQELKEAAEKFLQAGRDYREFLKRNYKDRLYGVVYVESESGEMVLYSEASVYTNAIKNTNMPPLAKR